MKIYYSPLACSMGIHLLLEEIGQPYEAELLPLKDGAQYEPEFTVVNPKSKVPTLVRDDGSVLTEFGAIATWLARSNPDQNLLPSEPDTEARVREALDYCVGHIHADGYRRIFRPEKVGGEGADKVGIKAQGKAVVENAYRVIGGSIDAGGRLLGLDYSIADGALFYVEYWSTVAGINLPPACQAHFDRLMARPATQAMLTAEGLM
ncbi:MAG: glutathione S-transferase N-terminal domain-containing protein [Salinisphaera sp.]|nr:glutathione S-transferase N-terminal domain-containing protein [Salinisphaera sp.]